MKVILFGATGMIGQGVLRECLLDAGVSEVLSVSRRPGGVSHAKLRELIHADFTDFSAVAGQFAGFDACFFCLGVSSRGMGEAAYTRVTHDFAMAAAEPMARLNPGMTFVFVSGMGTDSTEKGRLMWARVKGKAENALARLPFKAVYMIRPGYIQPMHGARSSDRATRFMYFFMRPFYPLWKLLFRRYVTTTETIGKAMLRVAREGWPDRILESNGINAAGAASAKQG
jgi:uncharacterized protein YbjT (DUF2867 family)